VARGLDVVAVDPAPNMLAVLRRRLPTVDARVGRAEQIPLPDASVGTVLVGAAFHWFTRPTAEQEIARVLRPGGRLGLLGYRRTSDSWVAEVFDDALHSCGVQAEEYSREEVIPDVRWFGPPERAEFAHTQTLRAEQIADLLGSRSYVIALPAAERARCSTVRSGLPGMSTRPHRRWTFRTHRGDPRGSAVAFEHQPQSDQRQLGLVAAHRGAVQDGQRRQPAGRDDRDRFRILRHDAARNRVPGRPPGRRLRR
jgi:SAM-dependent methyltransferase